MKEPRIDNSPESQAETKETKTVRFIMKVEVYPGWRLNDETVRDAAKAFLKNDEIEFVSWKKIGIEVKNGVSRWEVEVNYNE